MPAPLPASGSARSDHQFTEIWDKGKAAVIVSETSVTDLDEQAAVDHEAVDLRPRRGRIRRRAGTLDVGRGARTANPTPRWRCRSCRSRRCWKENDKLLATITRPAARTRRYCPRWNSSRPRNSLYRWTALDVPQPRTRRVESDQRARPTGPGRRRPTRYVTAGRRDTAQIRVKGTSMDPTVVVVHIAGSLGRSQSIAGVVT